ncbi:MBL fold metallo-hydrolase [Desulfosarcina ovata subsp. sediminis]|uniref:MBL fold metallo-hydrolase n=1 Tax=Desulfosarcina ovata subsp. sediminis TaxID=885957 RepID=A0A5K7ZY03_9BACT|nr:MBL fold metallo-hydrolase [Desulfosarcina ovata]BBO85155.1 MBL fold metallo-hydrolase [Desulfosarcina ovata subsp. sediminis]
MRRQKGIETPPLAEAACRLSVCVLASGSRGNATWVSDGQTAILIDAGLSGVEIQRRMMANGLDPKGLDAILVSHEHRDHIHGVGVLSRRFDLPVHISDATRQASEKSLGRLHGIQPFACGESFSIGAMAIHPFSISHDAEDPAGFTISGNGAKVGVATDLGVVTGMVRTHLAACDLLMLEANHDPQMLIDGPYPWPLKQRIHGRSGHLSNEDAAGLLTELLHDGLQHVVLAHLSEENNTPQKARQAIKPVLNGRCTRLHVASQAMGSGVLTLL